MDTNKLLDPIDLALAMKQVFDQLKVQHFIGGSIASSLVGEYRFTNDIDFIARLEPNHVSPLVKQLGSEFYLSPEALERAVKARESFNVIHIPSVQKVDIFVSKDSDYDHEQMSRRRLLNVRDGVDLYIASTEDIVLAKLIWFKKGGLVSDRQWSDILGVLRVQKEAIDHAYLQKWSSALLIRDLFDKAVAEALSIAQ